TNLVDAVVARQRATVPVVRSQPASGHEQSRPEDYAGLDGIAHVDVDEVLLAHDAHRGRAGGKIAAQIARGRERLRHGAAAELTELVALARDERGVAVAVDETRHDEPIAEIEDVPPGFARAAGGGLDTGDASVSHHDQRVAQGRRARAVEQRAAADRSS